MERFDQLFVSFYHSIYDDLEMSAGGEIRSKYIIDAYKTRKDINTHITSPTNFFSLKFLKKHRIMARIFMLFGFFLDTVFFLKPKNGESKIVYCGTCYLWDIIPAIMSKIVLGVDIVCVSHDSPLQLEYFNFLRKQEKLHYPFLIISFAALRLQSFLMKYIDLPIAISKTDAMFLSKLGLENKTISSSNGISENCFGIIPLNRRIYDIVYVGRILQRKNIPTLLEIFKKLYEARPTTRGLIITNTDDKKMSFVYEFVASAGLSQQLTIKKNVTEKVKYELLRNSRISINLSRDETFSISTMESAYCGNALILSDEPFFREIYSEAALFVGSPDPSMTVKIISGLLDDEVELKRLTKNSRALAERYTYDQIVEIEIKKIRSRISDRT